MATDQIQEHLRQLAAARFPTLYGTQFGMGNTTYKVVGTDPKGFVKLQDIQTGKTTTIDPTTFVYPDPAVGNPAAGNAGVPNPNGMGFKDVLSLGGTGVGMYTGLKQAGASSAQTNAIKGQNAPQFKPFSEIYSNAAYSGLPRPATSFEQTQVTSTNFETASLRADQANSILERTVREYDNLSAQIHQQYETIDILSGFRIDRNGVPHTDFEMLTQNRLPIFQTQKNIAALSKNQEALLSNVEKVDPSALENAYWKSAKADLDARGRLAWDQEVAKDITSFDQKTLRELQNKIETQQYLQEIRARDKAAFAASRNKFLGSAAAGAAAGYGLFETLGSMFSDGRASVKGVIGALGSATGLMISLKVMHSSLVALQTSTEFMPTQFGLALSNLPVIGQPLYNSLKFLSSGKGMAVIMAAVALYAWFANRGKSEEELAAEQLNEEVEPVVWHDGPVMAMTAGLAMMTMGINLSPTAPLLQEIMVPQVSLNQMLSKAGVTAPAGADRYRTVFVQQGDANSPTRVMYITYGGLDRRGNVVEKATVTTLDKSMKFTNPGSGHGYIPFYAKDATGRTTPNPRATSAVVAQQQYLNSLKKLNPQDGQTAAAAAANTDHPNEIQ